MIRNVRHMPNVVNSRSVNNCTECGLVKEDKISQSTYNHDRLPWNERMSGQSPHRSFPSSDT